jgi:hypothetical protein
MRRALSACRRPRRAPGRVSRSRRRRTRGAASGGLRGPSRAAQLQQFLAREEPGFGPGRVEDRRGVPLRQHAAVVVGVLRVLRVVAHLVEEERRHDLGRRQARGRMPAAGLRRRADRVDPKLGSDVAQGGDGVSHETGKCITGRGSLARSGEDRATPARCAATRWWDRPGAPRHLPERRADVCYRSASR